MATTETRQQAESRGGRHGFASTYNRGCRCPECKRAKHEQYVRRKVRCASEPRTLRMARKMGWTRIGKRCVSFG